MVPGTDFPTVVLEVGWSEKFDALKDDARLWLLHTDGQTRAVILVAFIESSGGSLPEVENNGPEVEKDISEVGEGKTVMGGENNELQGGRETDTEERVPLSEEQIVVESIDGTTGYRALAARLLDLNRQGKLKEPLIGKLGATVHVYKACPNGKEITESFMATLLPPPEVDLEEAENSGFGVESVALVGDNVPTGNDPATLLLQPKGVLDEEATPGFGIELVNLVGDNVRKGNDPATLPPQLEGDLDEEETPGFGVELVDLLGDNVPKSHKPKSKIMFSLKELEEFVRTSLPQSEKSRSLTRAAKLLSDAGHWEKRETWAQSKRR